MKAALAVLLFIVSMVFLPGMSRAAWSLDGNVISAAGNEQGLPVILPDGAGGAIVVWQDYRFNNYDIYAQRISASGAVQWTPDGVVVCAAAGDQNFPTIASDGAGGAIVTWQDLRSGTNNDIYAQRIDAAGAAQWLPATGVVICTAIGHQTTPTIVADGSGGAIITWQDERSAFNDIYAQRINAAGAVQWLPANGVVLCAATDDQFYPTLSSDGAGGAIVAWQDHRFTTNDIYARRIDASGTPQWTLNGVSICTAANNQFGPLVTSDGAGGAIVTWNDARVGITTTDIYAQRINSAGAVQWAGDGVALCTAANDQYTKAVAPDGAGGVIAAWWDRRNGAYDVYARRINAAGAPQWTADGVALCTAADEQGIPAIVPDGAGGAIATWHDNRGPGAFNIYAQRIDASGAVQWTPDGVALCTAANNQSVPVVAADGAGGAIVAWQDSRTLDDDNIYAQHVPGDGIIPTAVSRTTPALPPIIGDNYPNPFTSGTWFDVTTVRESAVSVEVFDVAGRRVRSIDMGRIPAGATRISFDGLDDRARALPSGVYFYRVHAGSETVTKKMVIAR